MSFKIIILTTETLHHSYFVRELVNQYNDVTIFCEKENSKTFSFEIDHHFENERNEYELKKWFSGKKINLDELANTQKYNNLNDSEAVNGIKKKKADIDTIHYSYPEGLKHCYSQNVIYELKKRGVLCYSTAISGLNNITDDLFHLKRVMI